MTKAELKYIVNKSTAIQINIGINIHNFVLLSIFFIFTTAFALYYHIIGKGVKHKLFHFIVSVYTVLLWCIILENTNTATFVLQGQKPQRESFSN